MAAELSLLLGWIEPTLVERIKRLLLQTGLPIAPPQVHTSLSSFAVSQLFSYSQHHISLYLKRLCLSKIVVYKQ